MRAITQESKALLDAMEKGIDSKESDRQVFKRDGNQVKLKETWFLWLNLYTNELC